MTSLPTQESSARAPTSGPKHTSNAVARTTVAFMTSLHDLAILWIDFKISRAQMEFKQKNRSSRLRLLCPKKTGKGNSDLLTWVTRPISVAPSQVVAQCTCQAGLRLGSYSCLSGP